MKRGTSEVQLTAAVEFSAERNLRVNSVSLVLSSVVTGLLGLAFWGVAARLYPAEEVGIAAALISSAVTLSTLSILSIGRLYERFLPMAGRSAGSLLTRGVLVVAVAALVSGMGLVLFGPRHALFQTGWAMALFPVLVMVLAVFTLQDGITAGLGVARWSAVKNGFQAAAKLALVVAFAASDSAAVIVGSWGVTAAAAILCAFAAVRHRCRSHPRFLRPSSLPPPRELWSYFGSSFGSTVIWSIGPLMVPLIVVSRLGPAENAYFAVSWAIVSALYFALHLVVSPYVAEVAANPHRVAELSWRLVQMVVTVACVGSLGLVVVGPFVLNVVGAEYRVHGEPLLDLAAVFIPLSAVGAIYEGIARVQRRLRLMLGMLCVSASLIVFGSMLGTRLFGVAGVGWAYLAAESVSAAVLMIPTVSWLRRTAKVGRR